jgi:hypothetical protein
MRPTSYFLYDLIRFWYNTSAPAPDVSFTDSGEMKVVLSKEEAARAISDRPHLDKNAALIQAAIDKARRVAGISQPD